MLSGYCNRTLLPEAVELMCEYVEKKQSAIDTVMQCIKTNYSIDKNAYRYDYFTVNMIVEGVKKKGIVLLLQNSLWEFPIIFRGVVPTGRIGQRKDNNDVYYTYYINRRV